jgi:hypothetical protein
VADVAKDFGISEWTISELVRQKKVECVRIGTTESAPDSGLIRFTDEQVAQIVANMTVKAEVAAAPHRRKRRSA